MKQKEYQFIFFLNISHSFYSEAEMGRRHSHTWGLELTTHPRKNELVRFSDLEKVILGYLERYQDKYLNAIVPFHRMNPSIENFLDYIVPELENRMKEQDWVLLQVKISENPTRTYMIDFRSTEHVEEFGTVAEPETDECAIGSEAVCDSECEQDTEKSVEREQSMEPEQSVETERSAESQRNSEAEEVFEQRSALSDDIMVRMQKTDRMTRIVITIP